MASLVSLITSSGECVQMGGGCGGVRLTMLDGENGDVSNMPNERDDAEKRRVKALGLGWTKGEVGVIKCLNPAIDLKVPRGSKRVARPTARPTAKRLQLRRGWSHLVTLELERATAYIVCKGHVDLYKFRDVSCAARLSRARHFSFLSFPLSCVSRPRWTESLCVHSCFRISCWHSAVSNISIHKHIVTSLSMGADTKIQPNNCNPAKTKRPPFTDITNSLKSKIDSELHAELAPPSHPSRELAMGRENSSETFGGAAACYHLPRVVASVQHHRPVQPSLPPSLLPSAIPHIRSESLGHKSSRRLNSSEARTQRLYAPDLDVISSVNRIPSRDLPATETPLLPSLSDTSAREPLSTSLLSPKTHKLAHGQLVILPSRSILVDFREGERKKGRKGDKVMVVSPIGDQVKSHVRDRGTSLRKIKILLYSAPHLSTPCCLVEPIAIYSLNDMPADWYRLYEQAKKVIEHIKRNVPKVRPGYNRT